MTTIFSTKLVRLLKTWQEEELKAFESWLQSPWCNTNKNLVGLFGQLRKYHPDFKKKNLTKERLFYKVLPEGKFSDRRMNNLMSEGYLAAEKFMIFQRFSQEHHLQKSLLLKELQGRYLDDWFFKTVDQEIDQLEQKEIKDWEDHLDLFRLHRQIYHHPNQEPRINRGAITIEKMGEQLDLVYLLEQAAILNEKLFRNQLFRDEGHEVERELQQWLTASEGLTHPAILLYQMRFAYTSENRFTQYGKLRQVLMDRFDLLNEKEQETQLLSLLNDTIRLIRKGQLDITDALPLYQLGLKTNILLHQGKLTLNTYTITIIASNTKGDFEYTASIIEKYTSHMDEKIQEDCANWAWAHTAYWKRDLKICLELLQRHHFKMLYFQYITKVLNTQAYFELYLQDSSYQLYLFNYFDTYEKWLNREKKWSNSNKRSFLRFVQKCRALARAYDDANFDPKKVKTLLDDETNIQALNWLKQKQEEVLRLKRLGINRKM